MKAVARSAAIRLTGPRFRMLVAREYEEATEALGLINASGFDNLMATARKVPGGRSSNRILEPGGDPIRLRPSRHGGLLARTLGDRFLFPIRPFREFRISVALRERGVPVPTPALAVSRRRGCFWRSAFGSIDRTGARDGAQWIESLPSTIALRHACIAFARALRQLHDAGGLHGDLHLRNILIEIGDEKEKNDVLRCILIDLDRTRLVRRASPRQRMQELMRFARSLEKADRADLASRRFRALTLSAYCAGDRRLRRSMLRWGPWEGLRLRRHRLGWWVGDRIERVSELARR
jgi:3-deoxy-D-manno-octulosonic acid kinase